MNLTHEKLLCILAGVFLKIIVFENPDVLGEANVEAANALHATDVYFQSSGIGHEYSLPISSTSSASSRVIPSLMPSCT